MLDDIDLESDDDGGSWFSRASGGARSLSSAALLLAALALLFWNESYSKRHGDALAEVAAQVQTADLTSINPLLDGKPVHLSARVSSKAGAKDDVFGVRTDGVALYRLVDMFQWVEYEETSGRGANKKTTYSYEQEWDSEYHDSSTFNEPNGHQNPKPALLSDGFFAADAHFGPYTFDNVEVARRALRESYSADTPGSLGSWPMAVEQLPELRSELTAKRWYNLEPGIYYRGNQASEEPELGDLQVSFYALSNDYLLTMIAAQQGERLEPWRASNGDNILLAAGGKMTAAALVRRAQANSAGLTHILRLVGLVGAMLGGAGIASWLGGLLTMIPVVGRLVDLSLKLAGGLFGLMAGLVTIVIGWLAARPWIAAVLLIAIGSAVTWAIRKGRATQGQARRSKRAGELAVLARQRAAEALSKTAVPALALAGAPAGAMPPPPPGAAGKAAARSAAGQKPPAPPSVEARHELPPLEWTPGLINTKPPAVRTPSPPPTTPTPAPVPAPIGERAVTAARTAAVPAASRAPVAPASARAATPSGGFDSLPPAVSNQPLFDTVPMREPIQPFDVELPPELAASGFDSTQEPTVAAPMFETVPPRAAVAPMFDMVPMREATPPMFETMPAEFATPTAPIAAPAAKVAPAPAAKNIRIALGSKGDYALHKIVRQHPDGQQQVLCFELTHAGKAIKRGTQDEVKEALRRVLSGGSV